jgi:hypothetical protein
VAQEEDGQAQASQIAKEDSLAATREEIAGRK